MVDDHQDVGGQWDRWDDDWRDRHSRRRSSGWLGGIVGRLFWHESGRREWWKLGAGWGRVRNEGIHQDKRIVRRWTNALDGMGSVEEPIDWHGR